MPQGNQRLCPNERVRPYPQDLEGCGFGGPPLDLLPDEQAPDELWAVNSIITTVRIRRCERRTRFEAFALIVLLSAWVWVVNAHFAVPHGTMADACVNYTLKCYSTVIELPSSARELFSLWL